MSTTDALSVILVENQSEPAEAMAVAGFLAGYCGATRMSDASDLRLFSTGAAGPTSALHRRRAHLELFGRWMDETGRTRSTVARRLSTLASFYRYCEQEGLVDRNPAVDIRRPKLDYAFRTVALDRNELGAFLVQAGLGTRRDQALASLLALNGLRISEALGAERRPRSRERSSNAQSCARAGNRPPSPLAPRSFRALDLYIGERPTGPIFLGEKRARMDRYAADRTVKPPGAPRRDRQADQPAQPPPQLYHRRPRRRGAAP